jgi:hypothetical protein
MLLINLAFGLLAFAMIVYLIRHYVFTAITLIYGRDVETCFDGDGASTPFVSIAVPAHNEEKVIWRLLERRGLAVIGLISWLGIFLGLFPSSAERLEECGSLLEA